MLKNINPLLSADILFALRSMGHGDEIVIGDANFPGETIALETTLGRLVKSDHGSSAEVVKAVLSLMPLDTFVDDSAGRMAIVGAPDDVPDVQQEVQVEIDIAEGKSWPLVSIERHAFYERAKHAFCVIQTGERRPYGCFVFKKGVVGPDG